ncbi:hypothetical protein [Pseudomonas huanghezhanensis]|uniref:hypothetical protein n=1 Tax=Pseudomonas huanghezhanensis TaxID=3002903 RepID=UPI00228659BC|nr:hypothetical protein [Pseudomonas sp. BSw22131]
MERIIEYPFEQNYGVEVSSTEPALPEGYCVCYQYDVNSDGYGPYGFETDTAKTLLSKIFEPLVYWNNIREKLIDATIPQGSGLFFNKDQLYVKELEHELSSYQQAEAIRNLRQKYGKDADEKRTHAMPLLQSISKDGKAPRSLISNLIANKCAFFLGDLEINTGGLQLTFFDIAAKERIKHHAKSMRIDYCVLKSKQELKVW